MLEFGRLRRLCQPVKHLRPRWILVIYQQASYYLWEKTVL